MATAKPIDRPAGESRTAVCASGKQSDGVEERNALYLSIIPTKRCRLFVTITLPPNHVNREQYGWDGYFQDNGRQLVLLKHPPAVTLWYD
jgi:hypothetical protein